jgi:hypothetical protein
MDLTITKVQKDLCVTSGQWTEKAKPLRRQVQKAHATNQEAYHKPQARRERSSSEESTEVVELGPREKGKQMVGKRESKRDRTEEVETPPNLMEVSPKGWQDSKQREGTYRYNYSAWKDVKPPHNPWLVREQGRALHEAGAALCAGPTGCGDLQEGVRGHGDLSEDPGVRVVRPPPRRQGPQVPQHEGHVGPVLLRWDVCHVRKRSSSGADRPRAALAEQAKGLGR